MIVNGSNGNDNLTGTEGQDTFHPLLGQDTVNGFGARDTLVVDYSSASIDPYVGASPANVPSVLTSNGKSFNGSVKTVDGGNFVNFFSIEHLQVKLDFWHNTLILDGSALALGATVVLDGGAGTDTLEADLSALARVNLRVSASGTTASFGTIISFETFQLNLTEGADRVTTGARGDTLTGNGGDDVLNGVAGDDILDGGIGSNILNGGAGNDQITSTGIDTVNGGGGYDRWTGDYGSSTADLVFTRDSAAGTATLNNGTTLQGIENISGLSTGSGDDVFTFAPGSSYAGLIAAGAGEDRLIFGGSGFSGALSADGAAAFAGNLGYSRFSGIEHLSFVSENFDDSFTVDAAPLLAGATLALDAAGGNDLLAMDLTAFGSINFAVEADGGVTTNILATFLNFERFQIKSGVHDDVFRLGAGNDQLDGNAGNDQLDGGDGDDILDGGGGADLMTGGAGADLMTGGAGNDMFVVDNPRDRIVEASEGGIERVRSSVSYAIRTNVENLILTGTADVNGTGNAAVNVLTGNAGANRLDGRGGADLMRGGGGADTYVVNETGDRVVEASAAGGTDRVLSSVSYALGANVENLVLMGTAGVDGTGNGLANVLTGNAGANRLDGRGGADRMSGGAGNDIYVVNNAGDTIVEASASGGTDRVESSVSHVLAAHVEKLVLTGTSGTRGTGNNLSNTITGNDGSNVINGGTGRDKLSGGAGNDRFVFDTAISKSNVDDILDFSVADDTIVLDRSIFTAITATGALSSSAFQVGSKALGVDDRIIFDSATGNLYYDADGSGAKAQMLFAHVESGTALTAADFLIVP